MTNTKHGKQYDTEWTFDFGRFGKRFSERFSNREGWNDENIKQGTYAVEKGEAGHATIEVGFAVGEVEVSALDPDSPNLFEAEIEYLGEVLFEETGTTEKHVVLKVKTSDENFHFSRKLQWKVRINPTVTVSLKLGGGVGKAKIDLSLLNADFIRYGGGVGETTLTLPEAKRDITANINSGVGAVFVRVLPRTSGVLNLNGGVGKMQVEVPESIGVTLAGNIGIGKIDVPRDYTPMQEERGFAFVARKGAWMSPNFDSATDRLTIRFDGGVGNFVLTTVK